MGLREDLAYRWRALTGRPRFEDELDEELRFHLEMEIEQRMAAGESRERATRAARLEFGAPEAVKESVRDAWGVRLIDETG
ncbi:MAG: permease prefix domain 1-containing protein, partial [Acidobacteriota bacterium]